MTFSSFRRHSLCLLLSIFFFNDTAPTQIYTLSLHDALPIFAGGDHLGHVSGGSRAARHPLGQAARLPPDTWRSESTRLNSSHLGISYAVFCLKKKNTNQQVTKLNVHNKCETTHRLLVARSSK